MTSGNDIELQDGVAANMGDGVFILLQKDERGRPHHVVVTREDLERLLAA